MAIRERAKLSGEYVSLVATYLERNFGSLGAVVHQQVHLGTSIIGKRRNLDILVIHKPSQKALGLECKFQDVGGTADEKIPYALDDIAAMRIPGCVVYAGRGFSRGVLHMLEASDNAAYCLPDPQRVERIRSTKPSALFSTWQLDHVLAVTFGWWDLVEPAREASAPTQIDLALGSETHATSWPALIKSLADQRPDRQRRPPAKAPRSPAAAPSKAGAKESA